MKIFKGELTQSQIDAGLAAMKGEFSGTKVIAALNAAGVENSVSGAEHLISREIRQGHISRVTRGIYQRNGG